MSFFKSPNGTGAPPDPDYEWRYEYYDDEEPVSFEGLAAHRYSIVISFWVGLAVFVIFMFFVLTLLTKTGAPHPDGGEPCEKRVRLTTCVDTLCFHADPDNTAASPPRPRSPDTSRRLFQCYVNEEDQGNPRAPCARGGGSGRGGREEEEDGRVSQEDPAVTVKRTERKSDLPAHFDIPNFVNSEHSLTLGEDDLLLRETELPIILEGRGQISTDQHMAE